MRKSSLVVTATVIAVAAISSVQAQPLSFEAAIGRAMQNSPEVAARELEVEAARSAAIPAGELPDPKIFLGLDNFPITGPNGLGFQDNMTMVTTGIMQEVPNSGKRQARVARAAAEIGIAGAEVAMHHRELAVAAGLAWLDLYYVERQLSALEALENENRLLAETVPSRIAGGAAQPAEAVMPRLEAAALENRRTELVAQAAKARAEIRRWIGAAADTPLAETAPVFAINPGVLRANLDQHPALCVYESTLARAEAETREAEAAKWPDWGVQAALHHRDPKFGWMVSAQVTFDLPLFAARRQDPLIAAKMLEANRVRLERDGVARRLAAELESTLADYTASREALQRTRGTILPLARQKEELQTASYRAGTVMFDAVLAARRERVETELAIIAREAEAAKAAARLAIYFGSDIP